MGDCHVCSVSLKSLLATDFQKIFSSLLKLTLLLYYQMMAAGRRSYQSCGKLFSTVRFLPWFLHTRISTESPTSPVWGAGRRDSRDRDQKGPRSRDHVPASCLTLASHIHPHRCLPSMAHPRLSYPINMSPREYSNCGPIELHRPPLTSV
jgi:hypothetical protein